MKILPFALAGFCFGLSPLLAQNAAPPSDEDRLRATEIVTGVNKSGLAPDPPISGFIVLDGKVYVVSGGKVLPLTKEFAFKVTPSGFVGLNGQIQTIPDGAMLSASGEIVAAPSGLVGVDGNVLVLPIFNPATGTSGFEPFSFTPNAGTSINTSVTTGRQSGTTRSESIVSPTTNANSQRAGQRATGTRTPSAQGGAATGGAATGGAATGGAATGGAATGGAATGGAATGGAATGGAATGGAATGGAATGGATTGGAATGGAATGGAATGGAAGGGVRR